LPCSSTVISVACMGRFSVGGITSPTTAHPCSNNASTMPAAAATLENVPAEVLVFDNIRELAANIGGVHFYGFLLQIRTFERNLFEQLLHNRVQPARTDILRSLIHLGREPRHFLQRVVG